MQSSILTTVVLPIALAFIMFNMGLSLTIHDFKRVFKMPVAIVVGLTCQLVVLPLLGVLVIAIFPLKPEFAIGVMLLALCPGGTTSNMISHMARADIALSISLTAVSSVLTIITIPIFLNIAMQVLLEQGQSFAFPVTTVMLQIFVITLLPVSLGMMLKNRAPLWTDRNSKAFNVIATVFFVAIVLGAIFKERASIGTYFAQTALPTLTLNVLSMGVAFGIAAVVGLEVRQRFTVSIEAGVQNGTLAITIASSALMLNRPEVAIPGAIYSLIMFATAAVVIVLSRRTQAALTTA